MSEIDQENIDSWRDELLDFDDIYVAAFKPKGISRDTALIVWNINLMRNALDQAIENLANRLENP